MKWIGSNSLTIQKSRPNTLNGLSICSSCFAPPPPTHTSKTFTFSIPLLNSKSISFNLILPYPSLGHCSPTQFHNSTQPNTRQFIRIFLLILVIWQCFDLLTAATNVRYAGFCFTGSYSDIPTNYKYTNLIMHQRSNNQSILEKEFYTFFQSHQHFKNFDLVFGQSNEGMNALAIALNREDIAFESIGDAIKAIYNLGCTIYILDFAEMKVIQSYPLKASLIDLYSQKPSDAIIANAFKRLYTENIAAQIAGNMQNIAIRSANARSMKVANITFAKEVVPYLSMYQDKQKAYANLIAQHITECFAYQLNITMLPYNKDYLGQKMSLSFTDATVQNFTIPASSYDIDVNVTKLVKQLYKETAAEKVDIYGAYVTVSIYDGELSTEYWKNDIKFGATKQTSSNQTIEDDFYNYNEVLLATFSKQVISSMKEDKKLMKGVIAKCVNY